MSVGSVLEQCTSEVLHSYEDMSLYCYGKVIRRLVRLHPSVRKPGKAPFFHEVLPKKISKNKVLRNSLSITLIFIWALKEHSYWSLYLLIIYRYVKWATMAHCVCKIVPCQVKPTVCYPRDAFIQSAVYVIVQCLSVHQTPVLLKRLKQNVVHTFEREHPLRTRRIGVWSLNFANSKLGSAIFPKRHEIEP